MSPPGRPASPVPPAPALAAALTVVPEGPPSPAWSRPVRPYARLMGQRVLVVDDDPTVSDVVRRYLERAEYEVTLAVDGSAALAAVAASAATWSCWT